MKQKLLNKILTAWVILAVSACGQTTVDPINNGKLMSPLNGNNQDINSVSHIGFGTSTTPIYRVHLFPGGTPTASTDGIGFGSDVTLYRSGAGTITLGGNLTVTGNVMGANSITTSTSNTWTGANTFQGALAVNGTITVGDSGITFTAAGATATRASLGLAIGSNVQAYDADLATIAGFVPGSGNFIVSSAGSWTLANAATATNALGLGATSSPSFAGATLTGGLAGTTATFSGAVNLTGATNNTDALNIGGVKIYSNAGTLTTSAGGMAVTGSFSTSGNITIGVASKLQFEDSSVYFTRSTSGVTPIIRTPNPFSAGSLTLDTPLAGTSGGLGFAPSAADKFAYSSAAGTWAEGAITAFARTVLDDSGAAAMLTTLGVYNLSGDLVGSLLTNPQLAVNSVGAAELADNAVDAAAIATDAVTTGKIIDNAVTTSKIIDGAVTSAKIADGTIATADLATVVGLSGGTYGTGATIPTITVNTKGQITAVTGTPVDAISTTMGAGGGIITGTFSSLSIVDGSLVGNDLANSTIASVKLSATGVLVDNTPVAFPSTADLAAGKVSQLTINHAGQVTLGTAQPLTGIPLSTATTGNYVASVASSDSSLVVTNSATAHGAVLDVKTPQNLSSTGTPTFASTTVTTATTTGNSTVGGNLTVAGTATFNDPVTVNDTATFNSPTTVNNNLTVGSTFNVSGVRNNAKTIYVADNYDTATDTRTGLSPNDIGRPFASISAAYTAAADGDTLVILPGTTVQTFFMNGISVNLHVMPGARVNEVSIVPTGGTPVKISGEGIIGNASSISPLRIYSTSAPVTVDCDVLADGNASTTYPVVEINATAPVYLHGNITCKDELVSSSLASLLRVMGNSMVYVGAGANLEIYDSDLSMPVIKQENAGTVVLSSNSIVRGKVTYDDRTRLIYSDAPEFLDRVVANAIAPTNLTTAGGNFIVAFGNITTDPTDAFFGGSAYDPRAAGYHDIDVAVNISYSGDGAGNAEAYVATVELEQWDGASWTAIAGSQASHPWILSNTAGADTITVHAQVYVPQVSVGTYRYRVVARYSVGTGSMGTISAASGIMTRFNAIRRK